MTPRKNSAEIEWIAIGQLKLSATNPRTHSQKQIRKISRSINEFGFTLPILIGPENEIIAGSARMIAARMSGYTEVPTIRLSHLSEAELKTYAIADNRLAEEAGWDRKLLAQELRYITELDIDLDLDLTGFSIGEIDVLLGEEELEDTDPETWVSSSSESKTEPVVQPGELWLLGEHRVICGDARDENVFLRLMDGQTAHMILTDPPYNVNVQGHVRASNGAHREFAMASGEMSEDEFSDFLQATLSNQARHLAEGGLGYVFMDWRHLKALQVVGEALGLSLLNLCIWVKPNGGMGSLYRSRHELVPVFKKGSKPHINNVELGRNGRNRTNVWEYGGVNSFGPNRKQDLKDHPTVKPAAMLADAIKDCTRRGDIVLDGFLGSGATLLAAERAGRRCYGVEIDPLYCDVIIRRWQQMTGQTAHLAGTQETFSERERQQDLAALQAS